MTTSRWRSRTWARPIAAARSRSCAWSAARSSWSAACSGLSPGLSPHPATPRRPRGYGAPREPREPRERPGGGRSRMLVDVTETNHIVTLTLNRPEAMNALNGTLIDALWAEVEKVAVRREVRALILRGNDKSFSAGAD